MSVMANVDDGAHGVTAGEFGELLRSYRRRAGLTQQALAQLATVSSRTIRDLELGRAHARPRTVRLIADGLGLLGLRREAFLDAGRRTGNTLDVAGPALDTEPPYTADPLIGRAGEVRTIAHALQSPRRRAILVLGLGGVGKSRVVLEVARRLHQQRQWPVLWVAVHTCPRREVRGQLVREVYSLLQASAPDSSRLCRLIGSHDVLLVLDGVTELTPTMSGLIEDMLGSCPGLRVVVTSRQALAMPGAQPAVLGPLPLPPEDGLASDPTSVPAVQLLLERLAGVQPGWAPTAGELSAVVRLCQRLDGLPLALEIVAHQHTVLSLPELVAMPSRELLRLCAPVPAGGSTNLWDLINFSCQLLSDAVINDLRILARLDGAWSVSDAETALGRSRAEVVNSLVPLTRLGLIRRRYDPHGSTFTLLNLVREFVAARPVTAPAVGTAGR